MNSIFSDIMREDDPLTRALRSFNSFSDIDIENLRHIRKRRSIPVINERPRETSEKLQSKAEADTGLVSSAVVNDESQLMIPAKSSDGRRNEIIKKIALALANNNEVTSLFQKGLELMPQYQFANNFRHLLVALRKDLMKLPECLEYQKLISLLASTDVQMEIVNRVIERQSILTKRASERDAARVQGSDESSLSLLELTLKIGRLHPSHQSKPSSLTFETPLPASGTPSERSDASEYWSDGSYVASDYDDYDDKKQEAIRKGQEISIKPKVSQIIHALVTGQPFQDRVIGLKELLRPEGLYRDIMPIPRDRIYFSTREKVSILNTIQTWLEDITALEWNWWPLAPPMPRLLEGETRVYWRCVSPTNEPLIHVLNWSVLRDTSLV